MNLHRVQKITKILQKAINKKYWDKRSQHLRGNKVVYPDLLNRQQFCIDQKEKVTPVPMW